jgi:transcriptional regulator with XRE-family HTH domain
MLDLKQDALASKLGEDWNQKKISLLEAKEEIDSDTLLKVAAALNIPPRFITDFNGDTSTININNVHDNTATSDTGSASMIETVNNNDCTFNPIDKVMELYERSLADMKEMYERLLASEREKTNLLK